MTTIRADLCIIGAGSGGLSVAAGAAQMGARTVLIEGHAMGGDCLNTGCVPSKALLSAAKAAQARATATGQTPTAADHAAALDHVRATIAAIAPMDSQERFQGFGVTVIRDWARFTSPATLQAGDTTITARRFVIATGSVPLIPPIPGLADMPHLTNETIFALTERPSHLIIIGGGPIGLEMAQAHRRLGSAVTVIEGGRALGRDDPDLAAIVLQRLRDDGIVLHEGAKALRVTGTPGAVTVQTDTAGPVTGSHLLIAAGRRVALDRLDLDRAGVTHDARGVTVGPGLRSVSNRRVYAVGDAAGGLMFTHVAGYQAGVVARAILFGLPARARTDHIPWATYTDPELAQVGLTEAQARTRHGAALQVVTADFAHNDRALAEGRTTGRMKVMVVKGRPVGASIAGPGAGDLIGVWALAISARLKMSAIAGTVLPYPTLGEINKRAASAYFAPRLFDSPMVKRVVRAVQRWLP
jgi:pyruvate/2-oxoglutarate dehydrogenase complex dihydrolipoamide dehydrogenase (E3) component